MNISEAGATREGKVAVVGEFPWRRKAFLMCEIKEREGLNGDGGKVAGLYQFHWIVS